VPDDRAGKNAGFRYLVTNRHVAQPGIEDGKPCKVLNYSILMNHKGTHSDATLHMKVAESSLLNWQFPDDQSVDLAFVPFSPPVNEWDSLAIPLDMCITKQMVEGGQVVEGDPVIFAGLFVQYAGSSRLEPIVRSGTIAMIPTDQVTTTLQKLGRIYLAEVHAFGGNSGSPIFADINKFKTGIGYDYKLLGVVSGEVYEQNDFTIRTASSYTASLNANSDISMIVPADEVKNLLLAPGPQKERDDYVKAHPLATQ
jgi:hypothetical protein